MRVRQASKVRRLSQAPTAGQWVVPAEEQQGGTFPSTDRSICGASLEKHQETLKPGDLPDAVLPLEVLATAAQRFGKAHRFSQREQEILSMLVLGTHPKAVGDSIGCSYASVRTHLRRMYKKLGCSGARELVVHFFLSVSAAESTQAEHWTTTAGERVIRS